MFTYSHVVTWTYRSQAVEAVVRRQLPRLVMPDRPLKPHQERVGEDLARSYRHYQQTRSQTLQPHVRVVADVG